MAGNPVETSFAAVVEKHTKAQAAYNSLKTTKELREADLKKALDSYNATYGTALTVDDVAAELELRQKQKGELESSILAGCADFEKVWSDSVKK